MSVNANQRCNKHKMVVSEAVNVYSTIQAMNSSKSLLSPPNMGNCFRNSLFMVIGCFAKSETDSQYTCTSSNLRSDNFNHCARQVTSDGIRRREQNTPEPLLTQLLQRLVPVMSSRSPAMRCVIRSFKTMAGGRESRGIHQAASPRHTPRSCSFSHFHSISTVRMFYIKPTTMFTTAYSTNIGMSGQCSMRAHTPDHQRLMAASVPACERVSLSD